MTASNSALPPELAARTQETLARIRELKKVIVNSPADSRLARNARNGLNAERHKIQRFIRELEADVPKDSTERELTDAIIQLMRTLEAECVISREVAS
jgi:hypothetical protein